MLRNVRRLTDIVRLFRGSRQAKPVRNDCHNSGMSLVGRAARIDHDDSFRLALRDVQICVMYTGEEFAVLTLEAIFIVSLQVSLCVATAGAIDAGVNVRIHQDGEIRFQITAEHAMQLKHRLASELPPSTLIGFTRIGKPVTEHNLIGSQTRKNDLFNMLRPRRKHERKLGHRRETRRACIQKQLADFFAGVSSAGFPRHHHRESLRPQFCGEAFELRALSAPIEPFEGDESAALSTHATIISMKLREERFASSAIKTFLERVPHLTEPFEQVL